MKATSLPSKGAKQRDGVYLSRPVEPEPVVQLSERTGVLIEHLMMPQNLLSVSDSLDKPHPLVRKTKQGLSKSRSDMYGALWGSQGCLDFRVSKLSLVRSLLLMDTLLKQLEKLGYEIKVPDSRETMVQKGEVQMEFGLYERFSRFEQILTDKQKLNAWRYDKYRFEPSGEFDLTLKRWPLHERHWKDSPKRKLEDRLTDIVVEIVVSTELVKIENDRRDAERLQRFELQRLKAERIQRQIEEKRRREDLGEQASRWSRAAQLRSFLQACETEFSSLNSKDSDIPTTWLRWAYQHADRLVPVRNGYLEQVIVSNPPT